MRRVVGFAMAGAIAAFSLVCVSPVLADESSKGPQVRGYATRHGAYSYTCSDTINTYGDSRSLYGSTQSFRDPMLDRQTTAGPFDHGFFFE
jgi:hypothetical protein